MSQSRSHQQENSILDEEKLQEHLLQFEILISQGPGRWIPEHSETANNYTIVTEGHFENHLSIKHYLLDRLYTPDNSPPLIKAIYQDNLKEFTRLLSSPKTNIEECNGEALTPLVVAAKRGSTECIKQLLFHGAKINCANKKIKDALTLAKENNHTDIVDIINAHDKERKNYPQLTKEVNDFFNPKPVTKFSKIALSSFSKFFSKNKKQDKQNKIAGTYIPKPVIGIIIEYARPTLK